MSWLLLVLLLAFGCFALVVLRGAPYLPTLKSQINTALELAKLKPGDTLIELGCGDGRVLLAAAKQGANVVGYELNPILVLICWVRTFKYRKNVKIIWGDFWIKDWPQAGAIFTFLLPKYMKKLDTKIDQITQKPVKLISFAFEIPDKKPETQKDGVFLYEYK